MQKTELTLEELTRLIVNTKRSEGKSPQTIRWYRDGIGRYAAWLESQGLAPTLAHFTLEQVRAYTVDLQARKRFDTHAAVPTQPEPLSDHSINSYLRVLRAFSHWLQDEGYAATHVLARIKLPKTTEKVQDILTEEEIVQVVRSLNPRTEIGARDQAIFLLLLDSGMRRTELCRLRVQDLNLDEGYAVVRGKGKKERPVRLGAGQSSAGGGRCGLAAGWRPLLGGCSAGPGRRTLGRGPHHPGPGAGPQDAAAAGGDDASPLGETALASK
jgi:site-specific recombinase XerD